MSTYRAKTYWLCIFLTALISVAIPPQAEAGLFSALANLGKASKVDVPDAKLSAFRFADELGHYPEGSVAEISFSHSQNQWLAKTPDGKSISVHQFTADVAGSNKQATLLLSERNLPYSLAAFNKLPAGVNIKITTHHGKSFSLVPGSASFKLVDRNISVAVSDIQALKTTIWQLQRPLTSPKMRLVRLAENPDLALPKQSYGSKIPIDAVGSNQLLTAIASMRQETLVVSAKVDNGFLLNGKQRIAITDLEQMASQRDVSLIILNSDKPQKTLQRLANDWQQRKDAGALLSYSIGDFYNSFAPKNTISPVPIEIAPSGQLRTALHYEHSTPIKTVQTKTANADLALLPLHVLTKSATIFQPNEVRAEELDRRIHPLVPSWVHVALIISLVVGIFTFQTSWFLFQKIWTSPSRANFNNWFVFTISYVIHRLTFIGFYLPLLGFISPIYLVVKWTYHLIQFSLIRPTLWIINKLT